MPATHRSLYAKLNLSCSGSSLAMGVIAWPEEQSGLAPKTFTATSPAPPSTPGMAYIPHRPADAREACRHSPGSGSAAAGSASQEYRARPEWPALVLSRCVPQPGLPRPWLSPPPGVDQDQDGQRHRHASGDVEEGQHDFCQHAAKLLGLGQASAAEMRPWVSRHHT